MKNTFFKIALGHASKLAGKPGRMIQLVSQLSHRIYTMDRKELSISNIKGKLQILARLISSYARGDYREIPAKTILKILAAVIYFLNPVDLIPDAVVGIGLVDDIAVLTWVYTSVKGELDKFLSWEVSVMKDSKTD